MTELKFSEFSLAPELHRGIEDAGFTYCTPIQSKALPIALAGRDVAGQAQTGTGKTAAYLIALFQYLLTHEPLDDQKPGPRALILAPTRELAVQIHSDATLLGKHLPYKLGLAFGGTDYEKQKRQLSEGVDVLIGTPGRLIDFFKQGVFGLRRVQVAVLDEADRMFDLGFLRDIRYILRRLPPAPQRLNLLFSATLSYRVLELAYEHMNDPELIRIEPDKLTVDRVRQVIYFPSNEEKLPLLVTLLREMDAKRTMVFVNTRRGAEYLRDALEQNGIQAAALSGDVPQRKRLKLLRDFQAGELPVLIATDVASRGLHVPDVSHVFNYDLPQDPEDYVHRVGRTARAGASGDAISFGCEDYVVSLPDIEAYIGRKIDVATFDHEKLVKVSVPQRTRRSERRDGRGERRDGRGERRDGRGERRDGRDERRDARGGRSRPAGPRRAADEPRAEQVEAAAAPEALGADERGRAEAGEPGRADAGGTGRADAGERGRADAGERRRRRKRGRRRAEGGAQADGPDAGAERERPRDSGGERAADAAPERGQEPADARGGASDADDGREGRTSKRRGRRGRRGAGAARSAAGPAGAGTSDADSADAAREANSDGRPRRGRTEGDAARRGGDSPRADRGGRARRPDRDGDARAADATRGDDAPKRAPGLLARIWSVFKR
ncbi:MAG TPA: DEAD/DEAH box helicase [Gammaproteobacteria bacterium]